jgi:hypothetical protein
MVESDMNIIKTVGDLKKALGVHDNSIDLAIFADGYQLVLNNNTQIYHGEYSSNLVIDADSKEPNDNR